MGWLPSASRYLWAAPASLVGAALTPFFERRFVTRGVVLAEGARWPGKLGWPFRAIALGHVVLAVDEVDPQTMEHELTHVAQFERWGPLMFAAYPAASVAALARGGHFYRDNLFEIEARRGPEEPDKGKGPQA